MTTLNRLLTINQDRRVRLGLFHTRRLMLALQTYSHPSYKPYPNPLLPQPSEEQVATYLPYTCAIFDESSRPSAAEEDSHEAAVESARIHASLGYPCVHVAGSNGKGSVSMKIARALELHGLKVGLYTSPHISTFRERIMINGQCISQQDMVRLASIIMARCDPTLTQQYIQMANQKTSMTSPQTSLEDIPATFFELTTALALTYFKEQHVDVAVLEVGLGGRLDSTNIIAGGGLGVIVSISLEHTQWLGDTVEKIAAEKGGIIKPHTPIVIGPNVPYQVIKDLAQRKQAYLTRVEATTISHPNSTATSSTSSSSSDKQPVVVDYDKENSLVAYHALRHLSLSPFLSALFPGGLTLPSEMPEPAQTLPAPLTNAHSSTLPSSSSSTSSSSSSTYPRVFQLSPSLVSRGLLVRPPCRFQVALWSKGTNSSTLAGEEFDAARPSAVQQITQQIQKQHLTPVIMDVGHNPDAFRRLIQMLQERFPHYQATVVVGFSSDKDITSCLRTLMQHRSSGISQVKRIYFVHGSNPRAMNAHEIYKHAQTLKDSISSDSPCPSIEVLANGDVIGTIRALLSPSSALPLLQQNELLLCCGTFFIMRDVRIALNLQYDYDPIEINEQSLKKSSS